MPSLSRLLVFLVLLKALKIFRKLENLRNLKSFATRNILNKGNNLAPLNIKSNGSTVIRSIINHVFK
jgi:hypothetical protein